MFVWRYECARVVVAVVVALDKEGEMGYAATEGSILRYLVVVVEDVM